MLPKYNAYGGWPASGEIDIVESRGNKNYSIDDNQIGSQLAGATLHWGPDSFTNRYQITHWEQRNETGYDKNFHDYKVIWTPKNMTFYIDNKKIGSVVPRGGFWEYGNLSDTNRDNPWQYSSSRMAPFDQEFYIIVQNSVGGIAYFPDNAKNAAGDKPWTNPSPKVSNNENIIALLNT